MIVVETDRIYVIYVRTNSRVKWKYSTYGGRYKTIEEAVKAAKEHFPDTSFQYLIENLDTGEEIIEEVRI